MQVLYVCECELYVCECEALDSKPMGSAGLTNPMDM